MQFSRRIGGKVGLSVFNEQSGEDFFTNIQRGNNCREEFAVVGKNWLLWRRQNNRYGTEIRAGQTGGSCVGLS